MDTITTIDGKIDSRTLTRRAALAVALLMSFRTFQYFPGMQYVQECWYVLCFCALIFLYPAWKYLNRMRVTSFEIYVVILTVVTILLPAWEARREFGQPLIYGLLAHRAAVLAVASLFVLFGIRTRVVSPKDIEVALIWLAWGLLTLYSLMLLFLNPERFVSYGVGFVQDVNGKSAFVQNGDFIVFGLIYYAFLGFRQRRAKYYFAATILFVGAVDNTNGRAFTVTLIMTLLFFLYRWLSFNQFMLAIGKTLCVCAVVLGVIYAVVPDYVATRAAGFSDAFKVVFTGAEVEDISANVRILEIAVALPYIQKNPLLGSGVLSHQWQGGDQEVLGAYFYPDDLGVIGVVFTIGVIGVLLFAYQFRFAIWAIHRLKYRERGALTDAAAGFLVYSALNSLTTGIFYFAAEVSLLFIAILVALASRGDSDLRRAFNGERPLSVPA